jgi:hypothetical protein
MTQEQYNKLVKYEHIFTSAIEAKYIRAMDSHFAADFVTICKELNIYINTSCPACVLKAAQTLGGLYFNYKAEHQNKPAVADSSDKADYTEPIDSSVISDSIDLFEPIEEKAPEPVKTDKPSKTATAKPKASQKANKQEQKKKSK